MNQLRLLWILGIHLFIVLSLSSQTYSPTSSVWSYGYGDKGGTSFVQFPILNAISDGIWYKVNENYRGVYVNPGPKNMTVPGYTVPSGKILMHPGNGSQNFSKIRFTAPKYGNYQVTFTVKAHVANASFKKSAGIYIKQSTSPDWIELQQGDPINNSSEWVGTAAVEMREGDIISFEIGNGGDGWTNDGVFVDLDVSPLNICDIYDGGIIFYLVPEGQEVDLNGDGNFDRGLMVAPPPTTPTAGAGVYDDNIYYCNNLVEGGHNDWFLPTKEQLNWLWANIGSGEGNCAGIAGGIYRSSTEAEPPTNIVTPSTWAQNLSNGMQSSLWKASSALVRPIRVF